MSIRTLTGMVALSVVFALGCEEDVSEPADVEPGGIIEVSIAVTGTMPDDDGYIVVVRPAGEGDVPSQRVESEGGTVRFSHLSPGTYFVQLESLAANCSVEEGANPSSIEVLAGEPTRIGFTVSCPGPTSLALLSGDEQWAKPSSQLSDPFVVVATDASGEPMRGATVSWQVVAGGGVLSSASSVTDETGAASVTYTLGPQTGANLIRAEAADLTPVTFTTHAIRGRIAFSSDREGPRHIYAVDADGSNLTRLAEGTHPDWSWDGQKIAFVQEGEIHVMRADGSNVISLGPGYYPAWAPKASKTVFRKIVFSDGQSFDGTAIMIMNVNGSDRTELLNLSSPGVPDGTTQIWDPTWSPDGGSIAFASRHESGGAVLGGWQVQIMNADGSGLRFLSQDGWSKSSPAWSNDGSEIAVETYNNVVEGSGFNEAVASYDPASGEREILHQHHQRSHGSPTWSPDARYVAFTELVGGNYRIFVVDVETGVERLLVEDAADPAESEYSERYPAWSPN